MTSSICCPRTSWLTPCRLPLQPPQKEYLLNNVVLVGRHVYQFRARALSFVLYMLGFHLKNLFICLFSDDDAAAGLVSGQNQHFGYLYVLGRIGGIDGHVCNVVASQRHDALI